MLHGFWISPPVYSRIAEGGGANSASPIAKWQISFAIYATTGVNLHFVLFAEVISVPILSKIIINLQICCQHVCRVQEWALVWIIDEV